MGKGLKRSCFSADGSNNESEERDDLVNEYVMRKAEARADV